MANGNTSLVTDDELRDAVATASSIADVVRSLGIGHAKFNHREFKRRTARLGLDISHFDPLNHEKSILGYTGSVTKKMPNEILIRLPPGSYREHGYRLTRALRESGVEYRCTGLGCQVSSEWIGNKMVLQVDHVDGDAMNNLIGNLRFLCPNCHSQTPNFAGRKNKKRYDCTTCSGAIGKRGKSGECAPCASKRARRIEWPSDNDLRAMLEASNFVQVGRALGVSDNAVRKHLRRSDSRQGVSAAKASPLQT